MRKILYAASECAPFIKTGGLGSVLGSLPRELDQEAFDVRVVIPAYECIDEKWKKEMKIIEELKTIIIKLQFLKNINIISNKK